MRKSQKEKRKTIWSKFWPILKFGGSVAFALTCKNLDRKIHKAWSFTHFFPRIMKFTANQLWLSDRTASKLEKYYLKKIFQNTASDISNILAAIQERKDEALKIFNWENSFLKDFLNRSKFLFSIMKFARFFHWLSSLILKRERSFLERIAVHWGKLKISQLSKKNRPEKVLISKKSTSNRSHIILEVFCQRRYLLLCGCICFSSFLGDAPTLSQDFQKIQFDITQKEFLQKIFG